MKLVFLQNAWFKRRLTWIEPEWSKEWTYTWMYAIIQCRSGQRLKLLLGDDCFERDDIEFTNSTPQVGYGSSNIQLPADPVWIERQLAMVKPTLVIACGKQALEAVAPLWDGPMVAVPHPTSRLLTNDLYHKARAMIDGSNSAELGCYGDRILMTQLRGKVMYEHIEEAACA